uniref:Uncharacterized protein n=1 Tax=Anguilla anguilla TaxID=7936 RepID=A0A0E9VMX6_ANGAN
MSQLEPGSKYLTFSLDLD